MAQNTSRQETTEAHHSELRATALGELPTETAGAACSGVKFTEAPTASCEPPSSLQTGLPLVQQGFLGALHHQTLTFLFRLKVTTSSLLLLVWGAGMRGKSQDR